MPLPGMSHLSGLLSLRRITKSVLCPAGWSTPSSRRVLYYSCLVLLPSATRGLGTISSRSGVDVIHHTVAAAPLLPTIRAQSMREEIGEVHRRVDIRRLFPLGVVVSCSVCARTSK